MEATALRALNSTFVRQDIVVADEREPLALPSAVLPLLRALQSECRDVCENARDIASTVQLWKERSLHQTLEALDSAVGGAGAAASHHEKQILAIETHEKSGREMVDTLQRHRVAAAREVHARIDAFAHQLAAVLARLIRPELEAELAREQAIVCQLVSEKQRLEDARAALEATNRQLIARVDALESAPDGGGDAVLCAKLRERVRALSASTADLRGCVKDMATEREKHRWDMLRMTEALEAQHRTFVVTKAMHEKETKQLVELVRSRQAQFAHVTQQASGRAMADAGAGAKQKARRSTAPFEMYDPVSGRAVQFASQSPMSPRASSGGAAAPGLSPFAASPPQSPRRATQRSGPSLRSQGMHQRDSAYDSVDGRDRPVQADNTAGAAASDQQQEHEFV
ncbi:hypothetical protein PybrP1_001683 [[Pythium] brassicae (nom. inval.)]|nr:hypothetical protein PybrP1_001683 [[Pythium] brassicae (nom. inval.)]